MIIQFSKKPRHPGMLLAGISAQTRLRLKAYRSDGGVKTHKLNDHQYILSVNNSKLLSLIVVSITAL